MKRATALMNRIALALSGAGATVWRNTTARGWAGKSFPLSAGETYRAKGGERVVMDAFPIDAGLCKGSGDIIGLVEVEVTPEMVGSRLAVFGSWEVKSGSGRASKDQKRFAEHVKACGGIAAIVRTEAEALETLPGK